MPMPTKRTPEVEESILSRLREGEPLAAICRSDDKYPSITIWLDWCHADERLAIAYGRAREAGEDAIAAQALSIMDEEPERYQTENGLRIDPADVANRKNRAEMRLKLLAKWNPKRWGDKMDLTSGGEKLTDGAGDLAARAAALLHLAKGRKDEAP